MKMCDKRVMIGEVGVDSGQLIICDPSYIQSEPEVNNYALLLDKRDESPYTQLNFKMGHKGAGVVFNSGLGDGVYEIFATIGEVKGWGQRIKKIEIELV